MPCCVLWGAFFIMERYSKILEKRRREIVLYEAAAAFTKNAPFAIIMQTDAAAKMKTSPLTAGF